MGEKKTHALLLKKTLLANDDAILDFFTFEWGRVSVFAKKFARSKKKKEIDFFRLLELGIFEGRSSKLLKTVETVSLFRGFEKNYELLQMGFGWIEKLRRSFSDERADKDFFEFVIKIFRSFDAEFEMVFDLFFRIKLMDRSGVFPHLVGSDQKFFTDKKISERARRLLEFLRKASVEEFLEKKEKIQNDWLLEIAPFVEEIEKNNI